MAAAVGGAGDDQDLVEPVPFASLDKATVLQECRAFHDQSFVSSHPKRCCGLLTKLLYLLMKGEKLQGAEATEVFFGVTKLFQSEDGNLRRLVYLFLKEVAESTDDTEIIIVVQSLVKDMNDTDFSIFRANAVRVLARIVDHSMLGQLDRYMRQAIVDRAPIVASSALVSAIHMAADPRKLEVIQRWVSEVQTTLKDASDSVQFHALLLLYAMKRGDKLGVSRLATQLMKNGRTARSSAATCLLVRVVARIINDDPGVLDAAAAYAFLERALRHSSEAVTFEAARAICSLKDLAAPDLSPAVTVLHMLLQSRPVMRFAAVRTLAEVAQRAPTIVAKANHDLEQHISDRNRAVATLAITTLLKTGGEENVDRLLKRISGMMSDLGDQSKIEVVRAIHDLIKRVPAKVSAMMTFLSSALRDEGGLNFKRAILNAIEGLMREAPSMVPEALFQVCEFVEDCEFPVLAVRCLHLLGDVGTKTSQPAWYIRFAFNRVILEVGMVRAAAVSCLAKFGVRVAACRNSVISLLEQCLNDDCDEVRDRAAVHLAVLRKLSAEPSDELAATAAASVDGKLPMPLGALKRALQMYQIRPARGEFSFGQLPSVSGAEAGATGYDANRLIVVQELKAARAALNPAASSSGAAAGGSAAASGGAGASGAAGGAAGAQSEAGAAALYEIPEFAELGALKRTVPAVALTDKELEYLVTCTRHIFERHTVFDFEVVNTIAEVRLDNASVEMEPLATPAGQQQAGAEAYAVTATVTAPQVSHGKPEHVYVCMERPEGDAFGMARFSCELRFTAVEVDPATGEEEGEGFPEEYPLDELAVSYADLFVPAEVSGFRAAWEASGCQANARFKLAQFSNLTEALSTVVRVLGLAACDGTGSVSAGTHKHQVLLSGMLLGEHRVLVRLQLIDHPEHGVMMKMAVRSHDDAVSQAVLDLIQ